LVFNDKGKATHLSLLFDDLTVLTVRGGRVRPKAAGRVPKGGRSLVHDLARRARLADRG